MLRGFYESFYNFSYDKISKERAKRDDIKKNYDKMLNNLSKNEAVILTIIKNIAEQIFDLNGVFIARNS